MLLSGRITDMVHRLISQYVKEGQTIVDATVGNGNDTLFLAHLVGDNGQVIGFDIQNKAIETTKEKVIKNNLETRVKLIEDTHSKIKEYIQDHINGAVFNLGYLPHSDKALITKPKPTIKALEGCIDLLERDGMIMITSYYGHEGGREENQAVEEFLSQLDKNLFVVGKLDLINRQNNSPIIYIIEKIN